MWISEERKYVRKTLKTTHLDTAIQRAENEFFAIKANVNAGKCIFSPTVQQAAELAASEGLDRNETIQRAVTYILAGIERIARV